MTVHLLYFAQLREALGRSQEDLLVDEGTTLRQVFKRLSMRELRLQSFEGSLILFLNEARAVGDEALHEGDIVAFCPPVSGG